MNEKTETECSMVDRVAIAIGRAVTHGDWDTEKMARAAIEAMREPTDAMKRCDEEVHWDYSCHVCGGLQHGWVKMIDAALNEQPSTIHR